jgi:uncharacterized protein YbjT (DUF2867 family)
VVRDPAKYADKFPTDKRLEVVKGDVTDPDSLKAAFQGAKGVIFAASGQGFWTAKPVDNDVRRLQQQLIMIMYPMSASRNVLSKASSRCPCMDCVVVLVVAQQ